MILRYAYVTLLSSQNYVPAVAALYESMKAVNTRYPLIVAYTPGSLLPTYKSIFEKAGVICREVSFQRYPEEVEYGRSGESILNTASKFSVFSIKDFDKLCYIDSDTFLLQNIDDVFNWPDGSMMKEVPTNNEPGFDAFFVFVPAHHYESYYKAILEKNPGLDGEILGKCWYPVRTDPRYQIPREYCEFYPRARGDFSKVKVVHFCNKEKPWLPEYRKSFDMREPLMIQYNNFLKQGHELLAACNFNCI